MLAWPHLSLVGTILALGKYTAFRTTKPRKRSCLLFRAIVPPLGFVQEGHSHHANSRLAALTGLALTAALAVMPAAHAQTAIYSDRASFNSHLQSGAYLETFDSLPSSGLTSSNPMTFSGNGFTYTAFAPNGLFGTTSDPGVPTDHSLSTNFAGNPLTITFTSGNVTAVGGEFFQTMLDSTQTPGSVTVTFDDGTFQTLTATAANPQPFLGFTNAAGIKSLTETGAGLNFATINNLNVGRAAPPAVPESSSLASLAVGLLGLSLLTLSTRKKKALSAT